MFVLISLVTSNFSEQKKVDADIEATEASLQEALSKLARLRSQRAALRARADNLIARGIQQLDEDDGVRSDAQVVEEQQAVGVIQSLGGTGVLDWDAIMGDGSLDFGGTAGAVVESSSNV